MPKFSQSSRNRLDTAHPYLQLVCNEVIKIFDFTVLEGHRGKKEQNDYYKRGLSKLQYPGSKHNKKPAEAVDIAPYPVDWADIERFYYLAGHMKGVAHKIGVGLRWGGDWDTDTEVDDEEFKDLIHFELA